MLRSIAFTLVALLPLGACGPGRTAAATQPTPAAFDATKSDAKAIEIVDASLAEIGTQETWDKVKQIRFTATYNLDGAVKGVYMHSWDRWNGRHNYRTLDLSSPDAGGDPAKAPQIEVFYDLFDRDAKAHGSYDGREVQREDANKFREEARKRLADDLYMMAMVHKLRDPGVILTLAGEVPEQEGLCKGGCTTVQVAFDPAVGKDVWFVNYGKETKVPEIIEKQVPEGRIGFSILGWQEAGGLKFPTKIQNMGMKSEVFEFQDISIGDPDDRLYVPSVEGGGAE
jgi:hypothetical protein